MRVLKWSSLGPSELSFGEFDFTKNLLLFFLIMNCCCQGLQFHEVSFHLIALGDKMQLASEIRTLLSSDLRRWGISSRCAVSNGKYAVLSTLHTKELWWNINYDIDYANISLPSTSIPRLLVWTSGNLSIRLRVIWRPRLPWYMWNQYQRGCLNNFYTYSCPDNQSAWHFFYTLIGHLKNDAFLFDFFDHCLRHDFDLAFLERGFGVINQLLAEHRQDIGQSFDKSDTNFARKFWVPRLEIIFQEIMQFTA